MCVHILQENDEFVENIIADLASMEIRYDRLTYTSDYFPQLMDLAERLIKAGLMYADDTPVDKMREVRGPHLDDKAEHIAMLCIRLSILSPCKEDLIFAPM